MALVDLASPIDTALPRKRRASDQDELVPVKRPRSEGPTAKDIPAPELDHNSKSELVSVIQSASPNPSPPLIPSKSGNSSPRKPPSEQKTHFCPYENCGKSFNRPARLAEHIRSHTNERPYKCSHSGCDKDFLRETHLNHHVKSAHSDVRDYVCDWPDCGKKFLTATRLRRHQAAHEGREKYRCTGYPPCNETFRKHSTLHRHITTTHLHQKPFKCTKLNSISGEPCTDGFDTVGSLRKHEARVHGGKRFWCTECDQALMSEEGLAPEEGNDPRSDHHRVGFETYALLQDHMRVVHPPSCPHCTHMCSSQRELRRHIEIYHSSEGLDERKTHLCEYPGCGRGFTKKFNLTVHLRTVHGGERRYVCGETDLSAAKGLEAWDGQGACGRAFTSKGSLEEHVRTQHLGWESRNTAKKQKRMSGTGFASSAATDPAVSTITKLTGAGYATDSGRDIACLEPGCAFRFVRQYDLGVHLRNVHGVSDEDINDALAEAEALSGGDFWTSGKTFVGLTTPWDGQAYSPFVDAGDCAGLSPSNVLQESSYHEDDPFPGYEVNAEIGGDNHHLPLSALERMLGETERQLRSPSHDPYIDPALQSI
ncbi:hypothetical protein L228DRAFT_258543 [Xylona heveae TC161]|uniref:C2H2-type domain-containing protein n=1 Tax=Xylona heveae (strain CBS 132557 / TC161) TaxID=1328760 RepID=A0A165ILJ7_XYLHT|nr:hypothetical protein L228DRAFT_258543 [Xylona heveae TC161]KZF25069.1 hypothetical protein L228DRAFT_258543 [Xylona heveae TC161]